MNFKLANNVLLVTAISLIAANIYVHSRAGSPRVIETSFATRKTDSPPTQVQAPATNSEPAATEATQSQTNTITLASVRWAALETDQYPQYMENLRRFGFPRELINQIIIADIDALFAPRLDPLKQKPVPPDAPMSERRRKPTPEDIVRMRELQKVLDEREQQLQALGINAPREMIRTPNSRNWEAHEYAVSLLPPEKQAAARRIQEDLWIQDDYNQSGAVDYTAGDKTELQAYREAAEKRNAALKEFLTPEEFERFQLHTLPPGTELSRNTVGMEPNDDELMKMFRVIQKYWDNTGGIHGRWRAERVPPEQIQQADRQLQEDMRQALGQDRYVDYQMATSGTGQQLNNLASRYDVSRETIRNAYLIQAELDQFEKAAARGATQQLPQREELQQKLQETLGPIVFQAWQSGRNQKYNIQP